MSTFLLNRSVIMDIGERVDRVMAAFDYSSSQRAAKGPCQVYGDCGCGPGGTCSNSCVSGCAERGGCGPHGPR